MCKALKVSRSGYYAFIKRPLSKRTMRRNALLETIKNIFENNHKIYGAPRITKALPVNNRRRLHSGNGYIAPLKLKDIA